MRIRTILAAAAAPAALGAVLLGTAGQASAATATPAVLAASVAQAPHAVTAATYRSGVEDTTVAQTSYQDPAYGYVWAHDYIKFAVTATPVAGQPGTWNVAIHEDGVYHAFANPVTGAPWTHVGMFGGRINYQVTTTGTPSPRNLPAVEPGTVHTGDILAQLFGAPVTTISASDSFTYHGIPGYPGGWVQS
jgi:hypothetical protein